MDAVPASVVALVFCASCCWWIVLLVSSKARDRLLPPRRSCSLKTETVPVLGILLFVAIQITAAFSPLLWHSIDSAQVQLPSVSAVWLGAVQRTGIWLVLLVCLATVNSWTQLRKILMPDRFPRGWLQQGWWGAIGFLASVAPVQLVLWSTLPFRNEYHIHLLLQAIHKQHNPQLLTAVGVSAVLAAPLCEELMYRVFLQTWLIERLGTLGGIVLTALLFSLSHGPTDAPALLPLALLLGWLFHRTSSYFAVVKMHALFNAYNILLVLLGALS